MTTYNEVIDELESILIKHRMHPERSSIFTCLILADALNRGIESLDGGLRCKLHYGPFPHDNTKFAFELTHATDEEANALYRFLAKCDPEIFVYRKQLIVSAESVKTKLLSQLEARIEGLKIHFKNTYRAQVRKSMDHPDIKKDDFEKEQLIDKDANCYGQMMTEIIDNLKRLHISFQYTNIFPNTLMHLAGKHDSRPYGGNNQEKSYNTPIDFCPKENGENIEFTYWNSQDREEQFARMLSQHANIKLTRHPHHTIIRMKTREFYLKILPLIRKDILDMASDPNQLYVNTYRDYSKSDPEIQEYIKHHPLPEMPYWTSADINFPAAHVSRRGFFSRAAYTVTHAVAHFCICQHTEELGPDSP